MIMTPGEIYKLAHDAVVVNEDRMRRRAEDAYGTDKYAERLAKWRVWHDKALFLQSLIEVWEGASER